MILKAFLQKCHKNSVFSHSIRMVILFKTYIFSQIIPQVWKPDRVVLI